MSINNKTHKTSLLNTEDFNIVSLKLASPDTILEWSFGEVTKPETINFLHYFYARRIATIDSLSF